MRILQIRDLKTYIYTTGGIVKAVDGVDLTIQKGEVFGIVGESGSGKTMAALSVLRLLPESAKIMDGEILFKGNDLVAMEEELFRSLRGAKISMVFQEPASAFNPVFTVGGQITEAILAHRPDLKKREADEIALEYLKKVRIDQPLKVFGDYPHQLSGGMKQRAMIAMALVNSPEILILDEPTTALDVTVQAAILDLLEEIIEREDLSALFISHDLGVVSRMCDMVAVMKEGRIVEVDRADNILTAPRDPYTRMLLESVRALG